MVVQLVRLSLLPLLLAVTACSGGMSQEARDAAKSWEPSAVEATPVPCTELLAEWDGTSPDFPPPDRCWTFQETSHLREKAEALLADLLAHAGEGGSQAFPVECLPSTGSSRVLMGRGAIRVAGTQVILTTGLWIGAYASGAAESPNMMATHEITLWLVEPGDEQSAAWEF